jgi:hypothetical protein
MSDVETAALSAPEPSAPEAPESFSSASEAAAFLARHAAEKRKQGAQASDEPAEQPEEVSGDEPAEEPAQPDLETEETQETEAAEPPIPPPASWPKEEKEAFAKLPRDLQEIVAKREQDRDRHFTKGQQETAAERKAMEAKAREAEQLRQQYEQQLPMVANAIQQAIMTEFPDIKTMDDVQRLAREDWPRYVQWDAKQKQLAQWQTEAQAAQQRQKQEAESTLQKWRESQDQEFEQHISAVPESERKSLAAEAKNALIEYGLTDEQVSDLWNNSILRTAAMQRVLADAARFRLAKRTATKPAAKPVPPVQRPGNAVRAPNRALEGQIAALEGKSSLTVKEATDLMALKAQRRRA